MTDGVVSSSEEWQWSRSGSQNGRYTDIKDADDAEYTPISGDVGYYLRATVSYDDREAGRRERDGDVSQPGAGDQFAECRS